MTPLTALIRPLLAAVAPKFVRNLTDEDRGDQFAERVKTFVDTNVTKLDPDADPATADAQVQTAIEKIEADPKLSERMLEMLIDAERDMTEKRIADIQNAREFRAKRADDQQSNILLYLSFFLLFVIIAIVSALVFWTPPEGEANRDITIQIAGAAIGFLTGIGGMFARSITSVFDFWFGSSVGSKAKSEQIGDILRHPPAPVVVPAPAPQPAPAPEPAPEPEPEAVDPRADIQARLAEFRKAMAGD